MSTGNISPKSPAPGYAWRWARASFDLMLRRPLRMAGCATFGALAMFLVQFVLISSMSAIGAADPAIRAMAVVSSTIVAQAVILFLLAEFGMADDVEPAERAPYMVSLKTVVSGLTVYIVFLSGMEMFSLSGAAAPELADPRPQIYSGLPEGARFVMMVFDAGAGYLIHGSYAMAFFGFFAYPLCIMMGVQGASLRMIGHLTTFRLFRIFMIMTFGMIWGLQILSRLPAAVCLPVFILYIGWIYAGAREIFTGQMENSPRHALQGSLAGAAG